MIMSDQHGVVNGQSETLSSRRIGATGWTLGKVAGELQEAWKRAVPTTVLARHAHGGARFQRTGKQQAPQHPSGIR
jgi:hypothetical protein